MMRLKSKLLSLNASKTNKVKVYSPRNCEELRIPFKADKTAKVVGKLASVPIPKSLSDASADPHDPASGHLVTGVLVQNDFKLSLMDPEDLRDYAGLNTTTITCKQRLTLSAAGVDLVKWALEGTFGTVEELPEMQRLKGAAVVPDANGHGEAEEPADEEINKLVAAYLVMGCVAVRYRSSGEVELEWEGTMLNDGIADSVMAVLFSVESSPAAVKRSSSKHSHAHDLPAQNPHSHPSPADRLERLMWFLEAQFGADNVAPLETPKLSPVAKAIEGAAAEEGAMETDDSADEVDMEERRKKEIERLHKIGIPVPGVTIRVDKMTATVWLEDLEVESNNKVFADRVKAVVERAVEVTAPLWG
jgi:cleavage and polyadenylation specificity factor subunit 3